MKICWSIFSSIPSSFFFLGDVFSYIHEHCADVDIAVPEYVRLELDALDPILHHLSRTSLSGHGHQMFARCIGKVPKGLAGGRGIEWFYAAALQCYRLVVALVVTLNGHCTRTTCPRMSFSSSATLSAGASLSSSMTGGDEQRGEDDSLDCPVHFWEDQEGSLLTMVPPCDYMAAFLHWTKKDNILQRPVRKPEGSGGGKGSAFREGGGSGFSGGDSGAIPGSMLRMLTNCHMIMSHILLRHSNLLSSAPTGALAEQWLASMERGGGGGGGGLQIDIPGMTFGSYRKQTGMEVGAKKKNTRATSAITAEEPAEYSPGHSPRDSGLRGTAQASPETHSLKESRDGSVSTDNSASPFFFNSATDNCDPLPPAAAEANSSPNSSSLCPSLSPRVPQALTIRKKKLINSQPATARTPSPVSPKLLGRSRRRPSDDYYGAYGSFYSSSSECKEQFGGRRKLEDSLSNSEGLESGEKCEDERERREVEANKEERRDNEIDTLIQTSREILPAEWQL